MLAGASVGTVEFRSITEPVREVCLRLKIEACMAWNCTSIIFCSFYLFLILPSLSHPLSYLSLIYIICIISFLD
jgi:hypothetical protein